jgi:poly-gamma-glutamate capsule biosynthesis protein CapA/YwtB (metallophosphatase superfamily)
VALPAPAPRRDAGMDRSDERRRPALVEMPGEVAGPVQKRLDTPGAHGEVVTLALCGDVMLGRGVDQILPHPGDPTLQESWISDARDYVALAEAANGPIPHPVDVSWPWGDALEVLDEAAPDVRIVNLETSITRAGQFAPAKAVHYRMSPDNLASLSVARPDVCTLANNHVMDFGADGLAETLDVLSVADLGTAGAGQDLEEARRPAIVPLDGDRRVLVFSVGMGSSGIPTQWAARQDRAGVALVPEASQTVAEHLVEQIDQHRRAADLVVVSVHMGSNWGYEIPRGQTRFAHALIDGGVHVVHGHSSHHPRPIEVYRDRAILYGCGDLINDYEGITGTDEYRSDLRLLYLVSLDATSGGLVAARLSPLRTRRLRLEHASQPDAEWLRTVLDRVSHRFGSHVSRPADGLLQLERA